MFVHSVFYISFGNISIVGGVVGIGYFLKNVRFRWSSENNENHEKYKEKSPEIFRFQRFLFEMVEISGIEPLTSWMPFKRSPSWAIPPNSIAVLHSFCIIAQFSELSRGLCHKKDDLYHIHSKSERLRKDHCVEDDGTNSAAPDVAVMSCSVFLFVCDCVELDDLKPKKYYCFRFLNSYVIL